MLPLIALAVGLVLIAAVSATAKAAPVNSSTNDIPATPVTGLPVGLRNNNPTNVKGKGWQGQTGSDKFGHAIFGTVAMDRASLVNGLRAAMIDLHTGFVRDHENTVTAIIQEWAGAEAPSITNYKNFVAGDMGVSWDSPLTFSAHCIPLVKAMSKFELGQAEYRKWNPPDQLFRDALQATGRV